MKPFTISEYKKDPSKLSSRLKPNEKLSTEHQVLFGNQLAVKEPGGYIAIYTEYEAAEHLVLRTTPKMLKFRPWKEANGRVFCCPEQSYPLVAESAWCGPEQTILVED